MTLPHPHPPQDPLPSLKDTRHQNLVDLLNGQRALDCQVEARLLGPLLDLWRDEAGESNDHRLLLSKRYVEIPALHCYLAWILNRVELR